MEEIFEDMWNDFEKLMEEAERIIKEGERRWRKDVMVM